MMWFSRQRKKKRKTKLTKNLMLISEIFLSYVGIVYDMSLMRFGKYYSTNAGF